MAIQIGRVRNYVTYSVRIPGTRPRITTVWEPRLPPLPITHTRTHFSHYRSPTTYNSPRPISNNLSSIRSNPIRSTYLPSQAHVSASSETFSQISYRTSDILCPLFIWSIPLFIFLISVGIILSIPFLIISPIIAIILFAAFLAINLVIQNRSSNETNSNLEIRTNETARQAIPISNPEPALTPTLSDQRIEPTAQIIPDHQTLRVISQQNPVPISLDQEKLQPLEMQAEVLLHRSFTGPNQIELHSYFSTFAGTSTGPERELLMRGIMPHRLKEAIKDKFLTSSSQNQETATEPKQADPRAALIPSSAPSLPVSGTAPIASPIPVPPSAELRQDSASTASDSTVAPISSSSTPLQPAIDQNPAEERTPSSYLSYLNPFSYRRPSLWGWWSYWNQAPSSDREIEPIEPLSSTTV